MRLTSIVLIAALAASSGAYAQTQSPIVHKQMHKKRVPPKAHPAANTQPAPVTETPASNFSPNNQSSNPPNYAAPPLSSSNPTAGTNANIGGRF